MTDQNKETPTTIKKEVVKKDMKRCVVIALLVVSILSNIASAWYFSGQTYDKIIANEYSKFGGKSNYELANQAQAIQLAQQIDQIKKFVEENKGKLPTDANEATNENDNTAGTDTKTSSKLSAEEISAIKKDAFIEGNPEADITLIEYTDPECPFCIRQTKSGVIEKIKEKYAGKVNNTLKFFKAVPHKNADAEAIASLCAGKIGGTETYSKYYHLLFEKNSGSNDGEGIKLDQLAPIAKEAGVDIAKFQACYDAKETQGIYEAYTAEGTKLGVTGTPGTIVLNNKTGDYTLIAGAYPEEEFVKQIDAMLAK